MRISGSLIFCLLTVCGASLHAGEKIVVAAFEYPPIYQNAKDKGLSGDIAVAAFSAGGIDAELNFLPAARMIASVANGQVVCGIGGAVLFEAPDIAQKVSVGSVLQHVSQTFLYDQRKFPAGIPHTTLDQMADYKIGVLYSSGIMKFLEKTPGLQLDVNTTHTGSAKQLQMGRIDVWAIVDLTGHMVMAELFPNEAHHYKNTPAFQRGDVSLVCSRERDANGSYQAKFKEGLAAIKKNGTYMQIMAKYYGDKERINPDSLPNDMKGPSHNKGRKN